MSEFKITINGGDLKHEWTHEQFNAVVHFANDLAEKLSLEKKEILITGFHVVGKLAPMFESGEE